jgi:hypothetical protein
MALDEYLVRMMHYVRAEDTDQLDTDEKETAIAAAVEEHSKYAPLVKYSERTGDGGFDYAVPDDWLEGLSRVLSIEYPVGASSEQTWVDADNHTLVNKAGSWYIRFLAHTPAATETFRLEYTTAHTVDSIEDTILTQDFNAVAMLAAAHACASLAAKYAGTGEPTLSVDVIDYKTKRFEFHALEKELRKRYFEARGIDPEKKGPAPAMSDGDMDPKFAQGVDYLTHPRRYR